MGRDLPLTPKHRGRCGLGRGTRSHPGGTIKRLLVLAAGLGLAAVTAAPASAVTLYCFSRDLHCQGFQCPDDSDTVYDDGVPDTGPWLVVCAPKVP